MFWGFVFEKKKKRKNKKKQKKNHKLRAMKLSCLYGRLPDSFQHISLTFWTILFKSGIKSIYKPSWPNNVSKRHWEAPKARRLKVPIGTWRVKTPLLNISLQWAWKIRTFRTDNRYIAAGYSTILNSTDRVILFLVWASTQWTFYPL